MIALTSATGKLGSAVLAAIVDNQFARPEDLILCTSSDPSDKRFDDLRRRGITIRYNNFTEPESLEAAFSGCSKLFLVSSPRIALDYNNAPLGKGREGDHRAAIDAAVKAGVEHIYYTSLAFASPSKAGVMRAHVRTEQYLSELAAQGKVKYTIIREGLYSESWPLYLGYYYKLKEDDRKEVLVAGDGPISWTAISDMAFATARVVTEPSESWAGKTFYLSCAKTWTLAEVAKLVGELMGRSLALKVVSRKDHEEFYVDERGMERPSVEWWSSTYDALVDGECAIQDPTLERILRDASRQPVPFESTVRKMLD